MENTFYLNGEFTGEVTGLAHGWYRHMPYAAALFMMAAMGGLLGLGATSATVDAVAVAAID